MRNRAFLKVVLLGLVTLAFAPGLAAAAGQGADLTEMLASSAAARATAVSGPLIKVTPANVNFGIVDAPAISPPIAIAVSNVGDQPLAISGIDIVPNDGSFTHDAVFPLPVPYDPATVQINIQFHAMDAMPRNAVLVVHSNAANGDFLVNLSGDGNVGPTVDAIPDYARNAFENLHFVVTASDPDGDGLTFDMNSDLPPTANAGGSYFGTTGVDIEFDGSGSSDPDAGQMLSYSWAFGDGGTSNDQSPAHAYGIPGNFIASLEVCDDGSPTLCDTDVAAVQIVTQIDVQVLLKNNGSQIRTNGGGKEFVGIEEVQRPLTDVDVSTVRMSITGHPMEIAAQTKGVRFGDYDLDAVQELQIPFLRADIRALAAQTTGAGPFEIVITGQFVTPTGSLPLRGTKMVTFKGSGGAVEASAYPNPFNPETAIAYSVRKDGPVSIRIYSVDGRLVRTLKDGEFTTAGTHEVRWNGIDGAGNRVSSGMYFVKTTAVDGTSVFKLAVTK